MSHNKQKKIAAINDMSGFGRCSLTVAIPVISHMKIQCCPVPTSIFSNHTGFPHFFFDDYTEKMADYLDNWKKLDLRFSGILTGFLGSKRQIQIVETLIREFSDLNTLVIVDPVMGDNGTAYSTYTQEMCREMKQLVKHAHILTPNVTEACILTDTPYREQGWRTEDLYRMAEKLCREGAKKVVISGIPMGNYLGNVVYEDGLSPSVIRRKRIGRTRSGTGDIFSAIIAADCVNGVNFKDSVGKASSFIRDCIVATETQDIPVTDGVCFEEVLWKLK